jgi:catechol 2,3-dioxygenase-like lactoylglutathione lyase family enzyme
VSGVRFQRGNHVVADLDRALGFYRDVLGFDVSFILPPNPESYSYPVFDIPHTAVMRFCVLSTSTQERVMALTEVKGVPLAPTPHPRRSAIVLEIDQPDAVLAGARALGLTVYPEEVLHTNDGRVGREIGIIDFDDNLVVIYKITGGAT